MKIIKIKILFIFLLFVVNNKITYTRNSYTNTSRLKSINSTLYNSVNKNNPEVGNYFLTYNSNQIGKAVILDNNANILFYKEFNGTIFNLTLQPNGLLSVYSTNNECYYILDSLYNIIDSCSTINGYIPNNHELILLENGHVLIMADYQQIIDMSEVVIDGKENATVTEVVIQELDENKGLVFEWRSWEHFNITDCDSSINLTNDHIDYIHANSLFIDSDTSLLLSSRNLCEITKINRITGEIIWRLGGKMNEFEFINDDKMFALQHSVQKLDNGNLILLR